MELGWKCLLKSVKNHESRKIQINDNKILSKSKWEIVILTHELQNDTQMICKIANPMNYKPLPIVFHRILLSVFPIKILKECIIAIEQIPEILLLTDMKIVYIWW